MSNIMKMRAVIKQESSFVTKTEWMKFVEVFEVKGKNERDLTILKNNTLKNIMEQVKIVKKINDQDMILILTNVQNKISKLFDMAIERV